jgi:nicotinamide mononucleotide (NMN) deamidase PncC
VWIGIAFSDATFSGARKTEAAQFHFDGGRNTVRVAAVNAALSLCIEAAAAEPVHATA